ncbi:bifunctional AP-4-A phosphorylase/ADP sulfurylase [Coemansia nantahalensis]|uniref:Bifunctional AP-4-A phosphorylase/ADP sulfurylase n=2 Tax=Coemansia TaxID=4863 RepID=A0ACC1KQS9_9FUNG|nr:bifunctional AP-4-A phosphorylase/ADP sulfurylase [Coemansia nantahalensis]KAJ2773376.1 bifunctional AP-4-A phosphorylase/ADP sulfurylase [Coemansia nantahalensis]KAJ2793406.1 bifunctional AP-4-A phosphorylase/ADP sulfurylase [Coemansia helicoidea]
MLPAAARCLDSAVHRRYASAVAQGALLFTESTVTMRSEQGVAFEIRYVPALAAKPSTSPGEKQRARGFVNPFLPYDERLHVASLGGGSHHLLLNKYCVVPYHLLVTTAAFRQQGERLDESDFAAVLEALDGLTREHIVFYNSGEESGASQPHKHLQMLPIPDGMDAPPSTALWLQSHPPLGQVHTASLLPFAHFGVRLSNGRRSPSGLAAAYAAALGELTRAHGPAVSYNMVMTNSAMMLFPRRQSSWHGISINSLGLAGLVLCKTREEQTLLDSVGVLHTLMQVGFPSPNRAAP